MNNSPSPFGKYADALATVVALSIIVSWLVGLLINSIGVPPQLDNAAWIALGYVFGKPIALAGANAANSQLNEAVNKLITKIDSLITVKDNAEPPVS